MTRSLWQSVGPAFGAGIARYATAWKNQKALWGLLAVVVLSSCSSAPKYRSSSPEVTRSTPPASGTRGEIVQYAKTFLGTPYRNGGTTRAGVDCSGLVTNVYSHFSVTLPRMSLGQSRAGQPVAPSGMQPGDLVFFKTTSSKPVSHVGIYIGNGRFIHASTSARSVRIDELDSDYFRKRFVTARRVID